MIKLLYTLCFCIDDDTVLMVHRKKSPHSNLWNGLGGKIEEGETSEQSVQREILEEAAIDLRKEADLQYCGVVTWSHFPDVAPVMGMDVYIARLHRSVDSKNTTTLTEEGILEWVPIEWVCDVKNTAVVSNIPIFLTEALRSKEKKHYHFVYKNDEIYEVKILPLA